MADLLQRSSEWLDGMREKHCTIEVEYKRGALTAQIPATVGKTVFQVSREYGLFERHESRDYLVSAANLVLGSQEVLPERGDVIRETDGAVAYEYEVMAPGNEPCWRWSDDYRRTLRIHTKLVNTEG
jgi:hypothetical protein